MSVALRDIEMSFGELRALRGAGLTVADGEVHALLGANGSGKSTLSKCLCGAYQPDRGRIRVGSVDVEAFQTPVEAAAAGVRVVHQDSPLINSLRVCENFALVRGYPVGGGRIRWRQLREITREALDRFSLDVSPDTLAGDLRPADRAMVSLALALHDLDAGVEVLILDEVTASIGEDEAMRFLAQVRKVPELGVPVLMVTHRFKEVAAFADATTILSAGEVVHSGRAAQLTVAQLVEFMTSARAAAPGREAPAGPVASLDDLAQLWMADGAGHDGVAALEATDITGAHLTGVSFAVQPGEILGVAGLPESGIHELPQILSGATRRASGRVTVAGRELPVAFTPATAIERGLASAPRDRHREGGAMSLTVRENMTLPVARRFWHRRGEERSVVKRFMDAFAVQPPSPGALFGTLSGGNQQKVVVAKWLITRPRVLVLDDPTAGVDPAARRQLFAILHEATDRGLALVVFSTEPEQFAEHCTRVIVLGGGRVVAELAGDQLDPATINQQVTTLSSV